MSLNDVWRNISQEIGIYWKGRWENVPSGPGVYGWFYPLRISTYDLDAFLDDLAKVLSFDALFNGPVMQELSAKLSWELIDVGISLKPDPPKLPQVVIDKWAQVVNDEEAFDKLRRAIMRGSLLMPPLYVGKTRSLSVRCQQHLTGSGSNDFHRRYEEFAKKMSLQAAEVNDLLFACIRTGSDAQGKDDDSIEGLVEEILKRACRPKYSVK